MKCSRCGHVTRTLPAMAKHVRSAHPSAMKRRTKMEVADSRGSGTRKQTAYAGGILHPAGCRCDGCR